MPLSCVCDMTNDFSAKVSPFPSNLSNFIITDRLWIQESMFCLLSNAMKYSSKSRVSVYLVLKTEDEVRAAVGFNSMSNEKCRFSTLRIDENDIDGTASLDTAASMFLCVIVEDNGIGVTESSVENLFRPFKQVLFPCYFSVITTILYVDWQSLSCFLVFFIDPVVCGRNRSWALQPGSTYGGYWRVLWRTGSTRRENRCSLLVRGALYCRYNAVASR
jgi:hypothetical protein